MSGDPAGFGRIAVVVPAHDEERLLPSCLRSLRVAAAEVPPEVVVTVLVAADSCTDRTVAVARAAGADVLEIDARNVGVSRHAGIAAALGGARARGVWLASTDADSEVPRDWLTAHLGFATAGWDAVAGTVFVTDWGVRPAGVRTRFLREYHPADGHPHAHGANLGLSAEAYERAGGFAPLPTGEDVALLAAVAAGGGRVLRTTRAAVGTSARVRGRAPGGFAGHLSLLR
ncbi:glycosyl transferase [Amycolatopsis antarctica]|uniref:4,4'-diaponeurosporenoate glycosyltransferase n=1 Tax=Amycolatopsis antarctica TaxID=1854586 RepID=A0A263D397_9PSEU|nr:glycosyltransferase [Amycolatopsis antarctica]OZM72097.1 glycosyl transferase [Amycolatopsis antarctica]